jgi:hypothetical protein
MSLYLMDRSRPGPGGPKDLTMGYRLQHHHGHHHHHPRPGDGDSALLRT